MQTTPPAEPTARSSSRELESLVSLLQGLSKMSLAIAQNCLEAQTQLPGLFNAAVEAATTAVLEGHEPIEVPSPTDNWVQGVARTPDELDAAHPPGTGDDLTYHVVIAGREPGLYSSVFDSNYQVLGVPDNDRLRQRGRVAALLYYRHMYNGGHVKKMVPEDEHVDATAAAAARAAPVAPRVASARPAAGGSAPRVPQ